MNNIAFIYEPHFNTSKFRVAVKNQQGNNYNYIVVSCSPSYNGVWRYKAERRATYDCWKNNTLSCYCVPIEDCEKIKELKDIENTDIIKKIKKQQKNWLDSNVTNRDYKYKTKPNWML